MGVYGWGVVAPGDPNVGALDALLRGGTTALKTATRPELGTGLFPVGDPDFDVNDYVGWIAERKGEAFAQRLKQKMGDNVLFALGACVQAMKCEPKLEAVARTLDDRCHVYVGSGVGDLPQSYAAVRSLDRATREWNHFWADATRCPARKAFEENGEASGATPPPNPSALPIDTEARHDALVAWDGFWAERSPALGDFLARVIQVEGSGVAEDGPEAPPASRSKPTSEKAHLDAIRRRVKMFRALLDEVGCPPPPWTAVSPDLIWNIQNAPAAQITMLLDVHGEAWAPVGACSTFGVALHVGREAILRGDAKMAIVGTTDPRPDPALMGAFHEARVMSGTGEVNAPFTSLRGTHLSGGSCVWVLGDEEYMRAQGLGEPIGGWVEAVALSSDAEHIITPSVSGPKRAMARAFEEAGVGPADIAIADLHATGTPGDLNELSLVEDFVGPQTRITARKGQLGHGMANSGGWELTALALGLKAGEAYPTGIFAPAIHPNVRRPESIVAGGAPLAGETRVGFKLMLGIGGITACVVMRYGA